MFQSPHSSPRGERAEAFATDDRRFAARVATIANFAKLIVSGREQPCEVHDLSNRGMRVEVPDMPQPGQRVWVEMRGLGRTAAIVVWSSGRMGGLSFATKQDLQSIFGFRGGEEPVLPPTPGLFLRSPRFSVRMRADIQGALGRSRHHSIDISLGGVKLLGKTPLGAENAATIHLGKLAGELHGEVRWKRDDAIGIRFDQPLPRDELFRILVGTDYALST